MKCFTTNILNNIFTIDLFHMQNIFKSNLPSNSNSNSNELYNIYHTNSSKSNQMLSLNDMCIEWLNKKLDKTEQCSDWSSRPFTINQVYNILNYIHIYII